MVKIIHNFKQYTIYNINTIYELKMQVKLNYELNIITKGKKVEFSKFYKESYLINDYKINEILDDFTKFKERDTLYLLL